MNQESKVIHVLDRIVLDLDTHEPVCGSSPADRLFANMFNATEPSNQLHKYVLEMHVARDIVYGTLNVYFHLDLGELAHATMRHDGKDISFFEFAELFGCPGLEHLYNFFDADNGIYNSNVLNQCDLSGAVCLTEDSTHFVPNHALHPWFNLHYGCLYEKMNQFILNYPDRRLADVTFGGQKKTPDDCGILAHELFRLATTEW